MGAVTKLGPGGYPVANTAPPSSAPIGFYSNFSSPIKPKIAPALAIALMASGLFAPPEYPTFPQTAVAPSSYTSDVIFQRSLIYQTKAEPTWFSDISVTDRWFSPWSEPVRLKPQVAVSQSFVPFISEKITVDKWFSPWADPVRQKPGLKTQLQQSYAAVTELIPNPATIPEGWISPLSDPPRINANRYFASLVASGLSWSNYTPPYTAAVVANAVTGDVVFPQSFIYQSHTEPAELPPKTAVPVFKYVDGDSGLTFQQTIIYQTSAEAALPDVQSNWYPPLAEPVRQKLGLAAALQQSLFAPTYTPQVVPFTLGANTTATSDVIFPRSIIYQSYTKPTLPLPNEIITVDKWFVAFTDPVRVKPGPLACEQQAMAAFTQLIPTPATFLEGWSYPWSEPVRLKPGLSAGLQRFAQDFAQPGELTLVSKWFAPLTEPVRIKAGLGAPQQQFLAAFPHIAEVITLDKWLYQLSEPVRQKRGLNASLQQVTSLATPTPPNFAKLIQWFRPLEEPRFKVGFRAWLQHFFSIDSKQAQVNLILNATETNRDIAQFGVYVYNKATKCRVAIKEIPRRNDAASSIVET